MIKTEILACGKSRGDWGMRLIVICLSVFFVFQLKVLKGDEKTSHSLKAGISIYYFDYKEKLPSPLKSNESGLIPGLKLGYSYGMLDQGLYIFMGIDFSYFQTDYNGSTQSGDPLKCTTNNTFFNIESNIGYSIFSFIRPYLGLGFYLWMRDLGYNCAASSYRELYYWGFVPLGIMFDFKLTEKAMIVVDMSVKIMFKGHIKVFLSDINSGYNDPESRLGNRTGFRIKIPFRYVFNKSVSLELVPWYEYSKIGEGEIFTVYLNGNPEATGVEPESRTHRYGLCTSAVFHI